MQVLVTGATGLVGHAVTKALVERGMSVRALVRRPSAAEKILTGVTLFRGDVTDASSLEEPMRGVDWVFHAAGMPEQWQRDEAIFDRVNRGGTANVLGAALKAGARRVVYTSTMDVFEAPRGGTVSEERLATSPRPTVYERSKQAAEREAMALLEKGLDVVFVNPSAVYGPSPVNLALNSLFVKLMKRQVPVLPPGGMSIVFVEGAARAHLAAAEKGRRGERYLISDGFVTNEEIAGRIVREAGLPRVPPVAPLWALRALAAASEPLARTFGIVPLIAKGELEFLQWCARVDASKAERELGFRPTPIPEGVKRTVEHLRSTGF